MKRMVSRAATGTVAACISSKSARARVAAALLMCGLCAQVATAQELAVPDTPVMRRWMPRHFTLGVGGVATSAPGRGTTYSPTFGGAFDASAIGYLTRSLAWRAEGFVHLHDRSVASETGILSNANGDACAGEACTSEPRETSRRTTGMGFGIEHHPMRGRVGVYTVAMLGVAGTNSYGDAGRCLGFAPSVGVGLLAPLSNGLDGFALEARWRRVPTVLGAVNAGVLSLSLRF